MCFLLLLAINNLRIIFTSNSGEYIMYSIQLHIELNSFPPTKGINNENKYIYRYKRKYRCYWNNLN
jgi:hypothetical protein